MKATKIVTAIFIGKFNFAFQIDSMVIFILLCAKL